MNNEMMMKLLIAPSSNMSVYIKMIEQQEKLAKAISPALTMSNSIQHIVRHYEKLNAANKQFKFPLTISDTLQSLISQSAQITDKYSKYYNQLNDIVKVLNPSLYKFFSQNTRDSFQGSDSINDVELGVVNSFDSAKEDFDASSQQELNEIKTAFENSAEFKENVESLLDNGSQEITTDIFLEFAKLIENYVGKKSSRAVGLFFNFLFFTYCILMPFYQNSLSSQTEERLSIQIENNSISVEDKIESAKDETIAVIDSVLDDLEKQNDDIATKVEDGLERTNSKLADIVKKIENIDDRLDDIENDTIN